MNWLMEVFNNNKKYQSLEKSQALGVMLQGSITELLFRIYCYTLTIRKLANNILSGITTICVLIWGLYMCRDILKQHFTVFWVHSRMFLHCFILSLWGKKWCKNSQEYKTETFKTLPLNISVQGTAQEMSAHVFTLK